MAVRVPVGAVADGSGGVGPAADTATFDDILADADFLQRYCERLLGDSAAAEDIVQETFLQAFRRVGQLDRRGSFAPWLATVARHAILKELRRRRRLQLVDDLPDAPACPDLAPDEVVASNESVEEMVQALDALNDRERALLIRQVLDGLSIAELAAEECTTVSSVKSVLNRARGKLRAVVDEGHARVMAPVAAMAASIRKHLAQVGWRVNQASPAFPGGVERVGEVVTATVAALAIGGSMAPSPEPPLRLDRPGAAQQVAALFGFPKPQPASPAVAIGGDEAPAPPLGIAGAPAPRSGSEGTVASQAEPAPPAGLSASDLPAPAPVDPDDPPEATPSPLPKDDGDDPEGSFFKDVVWAGGSAAVEDGNGAQVFALGELKKRCDTECTVLFHSADGGAVWHRLPAEGIGDDAHTLLVAPGYPDDPRIYVMTASGMRGSFDGGRSFHSVNQPHNGTATISPAFSRGDERILVGAGPGGWSYDAAHDAAAPFSAGSFATTQVNFAFAPDDAGVVFAGHFVHGDGGTKRPAVTRCVDGVCDQRALLPGTSAVPTVYVGSADTTGRRSVFAWYEGRLFRADSASLSFERIELGVYGKIAAVTQDHSGTLYLAWWREDTEGRAGGVLRSDEEGRRWVAVGSGTALDSGMTDVTAGPGGAVIASSRRDPEGGMFCSIDGGRTWLPRCPGEGTA